MPQQFLISRKQYMNFVVTIFVILGIMVAAMFITQSDVPLPLGLFAAVAVGLYMARPKKPRRDAANVRPSPPKETSE